jgi:hypothetical protein
LQDPWICFCKGKLVSRVHGPMDRYSRRSTMDSRPRQGGALAAGWLMAAMGARRGVMRRKRRSGGGSSPRPFLVGGAAGCGRRCASMAVVEIASTTRQCGLPVLTERGLRGGGRPHGALQGQSWAARQWKWPDDDEPRWRWLLAREQHVWSEKEQS